MVTTAYDAACCSPPRSFLGKVHTGFWIPSPFNITVVYPSRDSFAIEVGYAVLAGEGEWSLEQRPCLPDRLDSVRDPCSRDP